MHRAVLSAFLSCIPVATAQDPVTIRNPAAAEITIGKQGFVVPKGELTLRELIDKAAIYLKRNIFYSPQELAQAGGQPVVFQNELAVDALGCEDLLSQILLMRGLAVLVIDPQKGLYEVVFMAGPRAREVYASAVRRTPAEILRRPQLREMVTTDVQLEHINAQIATNSLRPFFASHGGGGPSTSIMIGTAGNDRSLLVTGVQSQVAQLLQMLKTCDVPQRDAPELEQRLVQLEQRIQQLQQQITALQQAQAKAGKQAQGSGSGSGSDPR